MQAVKPKEKDGKPSFKLPTKPSSASSKTETTNSKDNLVCKKPSNTKFKPAFKKESVAPTSKVKKSDKEFENIEMEQVKMKKAENKEQKEEQVKMKKAEKKEQKEEKTKMKKTEKKEQKQDQVKTKETEKTEQKQAQVEMNKTEKTAKKENMPIVSLTDEQYDAIFTAVLENVANMDMDAWEPKASKLTVPRVPKKKQYKITVGTKKQASQEASQQSERQVNEQESDGSTSDSADEENAVSESGGTVDVAAGLDDDEEEEETVHGGDDNEGCVSSEEQPAANGFNASGVAKDIGTKNKSKLIKKKKHPEPSKKRKPDADRHGESKKRLKPAQMEKHASSGKMKGMKEDKKQAMLQREVATEGTWVQCCNCKCMKWRYLADVPDPSTVPERWTCNMNTCKKYSSCDAEEEKYDEREHIFTKYTEGSVVWAKMTGYPWWPAMVEIDPDEETYFLMAAQQDMIPKWFHVVFFDDKVSRGWVKSIHVKRFTSEEDVNVQQGRKGSSYTKEINTAKRNAKQALDYSVKERIEQFGFAARYRGKWYSSTTNNGANSSKPRTGSAVSSRKKTVVRETLVDEEEEELDESTMDDVMDNAESLLENVAEMLDCLDSSLDDSDEDSDFSADELVVVERKRLTRQKDQDNAGNNKKKQKTDSAMENTDDTSDLAPPVNDSRSPLPAYHMDETGDAKSTASTNLTLDRELSDNEASIGKMSEDTKNVPSIKSSKSKSGPTNDTQKNDSKKKKSKTTKKAMDAEIVKKCEKKEVDNSVKEENVAEKVKTNSGATIESKNKKQKKENKLKDTVTDTIQKKVENDSNVTVGNKNEKSVNKMKKKGFAAPSKGKDSFQVNGRTVSDTTDMKSSPAETSKTSIFSVMAEKKSVNKLSKTKKGMTKNLEEKARDTQVNETTSNIKSGVQKITEGNDDEDFDLVEDTTDIKSSLSQNSHNSLSQNSNNSLSQNSNNSLSQNSITSIFDVMAKKEAMNKLSKNKKGTSKNLGKKARDTKVNETTSNIEKSGVQKTTECSDDDDFDLFEDDNEVPNVNDTKTDKCAPATGGRSVDADSEAEFELEEHSLYDGEADDAAKVREREVVPAPTPVVVSYDDDDSDPFDMMEE